MMANVFFARLILTVFVTATFGFLAAAFGEKMDEGTHGVLIEKLERVLETMEKGDESQQPVIVRLADLYAERARITAMSAMANGGTDSGASARKDRKRALELYYSVFDKLPAGDKGRAL
ncbi:MAG TPA: hypothetical protein VFV50_05955, partial [Bdellovibrionales bacterium]|nr:hypothetical protein [Bdellovibrionales bacterium]